MFEKLNNHKRTVKENIELEKLPFKPLKEFKGLELIVDGFFFTQGKYGDQVVVVANNSKINMPARAVESFKTIAEDPEMLNAVLNGHLKLTNIQEISTRNGSTTTFTFKDC